VYPFLRNNGSYIAYLGRTKPDTPMLALLIAFLYMTPLLMIAAAMVRRAVTI